MIEILESKGYKIIKPTISSTNTKNIDKNIINNFQLAITIKNVETNGYIVTLPKNQSSFSSVTVGKEETLDLGSKIKYLKSKGYTVEHVKKLNYPNGLTIELDIILL